MSLKAFLLSTLESHVISKIFMILTILINIFYVFTGCGDYNLREISFLPDPCPLPEKEKRRSLNEKERLVYAPMSGVGGVVYDKV